MLSGDVPRLVVLDERGRCISERSLPSRPERWFWHPYWVLDVDRDGNDELAFLHGGQDQQSRLTVTAATDLQQEVWSFNLTQAGLGEVRQVVRTSIDAAPCFLAVAKGPVPELMALSAASGEVQWRCPSTAAGGSQQVDSEPQLAVLGEVAPDRRPFVLASGGNLSIVRQAAPAGDQTAHSWRTSAGLSHASDPRLLRPLPWVPMHGGAALRFELPRLGMICLIWLIPVWALGRSTWSMLRSRRVSLSAAMTTLGLFCLLLALSLYGPLPSGLRTGNWISDVQRRLTGLVLLLLIVTPLSYLLWLLVRVMYRRRFAWFAVALAATLVASATVGWFMILEAERSNPLGPGEQWRWSGWPWVLGYGFYAVGWLSILLRGGKAAVVSLGRLLHRRSPVGVSS